MEGKFQPTDRPTTDRDFLTGLNINRIKLKTNEELGKRIRSTSRSTSLNYSEWFQCGRYQFLINTS